MEEIISKKDRVNGAIKFVNYLGSRDVAEYIVNLQEAVDGLTKNIETFIIAFAKIYYEKEKAKIDKKGKIETWLNEGSD